MGYTRICQACEQWTLPDRECHLCDRDKRIARWQEQKACKVCATPPNVRGEIYHSDACLHVREDGGGVEYVEAFSEGT
jgi:hypothetical protein